MTQSLNSALSAGFEDYDDEIATTGEVDPIPPQELATVDESTYETVTQPEDALARSSRIPPKLVEDVQSNPELLRPVARSMAAVNLHNLFTRIQHPNTNTRDRLEFQSLLNKMSGLDAKETSAAQGAGFSINIVLPGHSAKSLTIDGSSTEVPAEQ